MAKNNETAPGPIPTPLELVQQNPHVKAAVDPGAQTDAPPARKGRAEAAAETVADLGKDPAAVAAMFDKVASRYDLTNTILTAGQDQLWRVATRAAVDAGPGQRILDLAAGTGTSAATFAADGAEVIAADFSPGMVAEGRRRHPELTFVTADATDLPFPDAYFDCVTVSYGLRNFQDTAAALREALRVTKPGGRLVVAEFSTPTNPVLRQLYSFVLRRVMPVIARLVSSHDSAYGYLAESIAAWPDQEELGRIIAAAGWQRVEYRNLSGGIVAIHRAFAE